MPKDRKLLIAAVAVCTGLIVLFLLLPKQSATVRQKVEQMASVPVNEDSLKMLEAISLVNGPEPMRGIKMLQSMVEKDSTNAEAHFYLGSFSVQSGQVDKAIKRFDKVIALQPDNLRYLVEIGYQYLQMDSLTRGIGCFEKASLVDSTENNALFFAAQAYEKLGNLEKAKMKYLTLLRHNTDAVVDSAVRTYVNNIDKKLNK